MVSKITKNNKASGPATRKEWIPTAISIIAMIISAASFVWSREQFVRNSRPYVWACNYQGHVLGTNNIIQMPHMVACRVYNSPANILRFDIKIVLGNKDLTNFPSIKMIRYPDEKIEWNNEIIKDDFDKIMNLADTEKNKLRRIISIDYSSLSGGKTYHYNLEQIFRTDLNQWDHVKEEAD